MPSAFDLETQEGVRRVEFDPDVFRSRDIRLLVDGKRVAEMPYPVAAAPHQEVIFQLGDHALVAAAQLAAEPDLRTGSVLTYDLFADGRSLSGGASLELMRAHAPAPGTAYPGSFRVIDAIYLVAPAAGASGLALGFARSADQLGWPTTITLLAGLFASLWAANTIGVRAWSRMRTDASRSVPWRATLGFAIAVGCYGTAFLGWLAIAVFIGLGRR